MSPTLEPPLFVERRWMIKPLVMLYAFLALALVFGLIGYRPRSVGEVAVISGVFLVVLTVMHGVVVLLPDSGVGKRVRVDRGTLSMRGPTGGITVPLTSIVEVILLDGSSAVDVAVRRRWRDAPIRRSNLVAIGNTHDAVLVVHRRGGETEGLLLSVTQADELVAALRTAGVPTGAFLDGRWPTADRD